MIVRGIQIDITVRKYLTDGVTFEAPSCDHSCWSSNYKCPSAYSPNRVPGEYAPWELLVTAIKNTDRGLRRAYPKEGQTEVNLFGGNAALHPGVLRIIRALREYSVCLSLPGRKVITDLEFCNGLISVHPQLVAFSVDSISALTIDELVDCQDVLEVYDGIPSQAQKAVSGVCAAIELQKRKNAPKVLFNVVIHPGNIDVIYDIIDALGRNFEDCLINPYPAQSAFYMGKNVFDVGHVPMLCKFIDIMLNSPPPNVLDRRFYWEKLSSLAYLSPNAFCRALSGYEVWKCDHGHNPYVQLGRYKPEISLHKFPGGYLNCFWNPNGNCDVQMWDASDGEVDEILPQFGSSTCPGCIMPRLMFDNDNTELGRGNA